MDLINYYDCSYIFDIPSLMVSMCFLSSFTVCSICALFSRYCGELILTSTSLITDLSSSCILTSPKMAEWLLLTACLCAVWRDGWRTILEKMEHDGVLMDATVLVMRCLLLGIIMMMR